MHVWLQRSAKANAGNAQYRLTIPSDTTVCSARVEGDSSGLVHHWDNVLLVHHEACCGMGAKVNLKKKTKKLVYSSPQTQVPLVCCF